MERKCKTCIWWEEYKDYGFCNEKEVYMHKDDHCPKWLCKPPEAEEE